MLFLASPCVNPAPKLSYGRLFIYLKEHPFKIHLGDGVDDQGYFLCPGFACIQAKRFIIRKRHVLEQEVAVEYKTFGAFKLVICRQEGFQYDEYKVGRKIMLAQ